MTNLVALVSSITNDWTIEMATDAIEKLIRIGEPLDAISLQLAVRADNLPKPFTAAELLRVAGARALESNDAVGRSQVEQAIKNQLQAGASAGLKDFVEVAGYHCVAAIWNNYHAVDAVWRWYIESTANLTHQLRFHRVIATLRVGAAGLLAGNLSIALKAALHLRGENLSTVRLEDLMHHIGPKEQVRSELRGRYLGADAELALVDFVKFMAGTVPSIH